jgi:uncharacterized protein (TIGR02246 family)
MSPEDAVRDLYGRIIAGWNAGDARAMAAPMAPEALMIGFGGRQLREALTEELSKELAQRS